MGSKPLPRLSPDEEIDEIIQLTEEFHGWIKAVWLCVGVLDTHLFGLWRHGGAREARGVSPVRLPSHPELTGLTPPGPGLNPDRRRQVGEG